MFSVLTDIILWIAHLYIALITKNLIFSNNKEIAKNVIFVHFPYCFVLFYSATIWWNAACLHGNCSFYDTNDRRIEIATESMIPDIFYFFSTNIWSNASLITDLVQYATTALGISSGVVIILLCFRYRSHSGCSTTSVHGRYIYWF